MIRSLGGEKRACCLVHGLPASDSVRPRVNRGHRPIEKQAAAHYFVTMFRNPLQRLQSAFYAGLHDASPAAYESVLCPAAYARLDGISNCQTKMLLGCTCGDTCGGLGVATETQSSYARRALEEARAVVDQLLFVGVQEAWACSMELFSRKFNSTWASDAAAGAATRLRVGVAHSDKGYMHMYDTAALDVAYQKSWSESQPWTSCFRTGDAVHGVRLARNVSPTIRWDVPSVKLEQLDWEVWRYAKLRFRRELKEHGIQSCLPS